MQSLAAYLPQDRRQALAHGRALPDRAQGTVLFADISGFTTLAEALREALGARPGSEQLSNQINYIYDALIGHVDAHRGSVIGFAGDAITCWFDNAEGLAAPRAAACALALQTAMDEMTYAPLPHGGAVTLALKVAIASGQARRFVAGDPAIQALDLLAGATVERVATGEHLTHPGEVLIDNATLAALGPGAILGEWRVDAESGEVFTLLKGLSAPPAAAPWAPVPLTADTLRPWVLPAVYAREVAGHETFLTELRPAVAVFVRFTGIDYDADPDAQTRLDTFIRIAQGVLARFGGALLQAVIGDKGSYLCCAFGAPVAHEDDARRAVLAALELQREAPAAGLPRLQIGISQGAMRCGAYGSSARRTYGILGDEVNLAARLMGLAAPGATLISGNVRPAVVNRVTLEPRPPVRLKGKGEPVPVFAVDGLRHERAMRLQEPSYALPMVGRTSELTTLSDFLDRAMGSHGHIVGICAEAGLGKSRLVAEVVRLAHQSGVAGYGGACQATGTRTPYLVWQPIWRALFDIAPDAPPRRQIRELAALVDEWASDRVAALPLLGPLVGLALPENDFTAALDARDRQSALHALLRDCLAAAAREARSAGGGLLLVLEDVHWLDAASAALLVDLTHGLAALPVLLVLTYRPLEPELAENLEALPGFTELNLLGLDQMAAEQLIRAKLLQLFPERGGALPAELVQQLMDQTQGNPFYLEELLNYLHDRAIDPREEGALVALSLPESLHRLILSRLDQLSGDQQVILKVSSVMGRRFLVAWMRGAFPTLGPPEMLRAELEALADLELMSLDTPEPELAYLFKHVVTREVAYGSLSAATRAALHGQLAAYLELGVGAEADGMLDMLAYHYEQSDNLAKKRQYLRRAGEAAASRYANSAATAYFSRALELVPLDDPAERMELLLAREQLYALQGAREAQLADLIAVAALARELGTSKPQAEAALRRARYANDTGDFLAAEEAAREAIALASAAALPNLEATAYQRLGWALSCQRSYVAAQSALEHSLELAEATGDSHQLCATLNVLSNVSADQGRYEAACSYLERSSTIARATGNRRMEGYALNNLASIMGEQGRPLAAQSYSEQCLAAMRAVGDRWLEARALANLAFAQLLLGDLAAARARLEQSLVLASETRDRQLMAYTCGNLGLAALGQGDTAGAGTSFQRCLDLAENLGDRLLAGLARRGLGNVALARGALEVAQEAFSASTALLREVGSPALVAEPLAGLARVALARGDTSTALAHVAEILAHLESGTLDGAEEAMLVYLTCYQALAAGGDPRAPALLARARTELLARAEQITDSQVRTTFLEQVPVHRVILALP